MPPSIDTSSVLAASILPLKAVGCVSTCRPMILSPLGARPSFAPSISSALSLVCVAVPVPVPLAVKV